MSIQKPSRYNQAGFSFQDFLLYSDPPEEARYIQAKWDGYAFEAFAETFDFETPSLSGGPVIARLDYTKVGSVTTIDHWDINWRDDWPLRLALGFLLYCLRTTTGAAFVRVRKEAYQFWVSEGFEPENNDPDGFLIKK